jgi:hypothetical protein
MSPYSSVFRESIWGGVPISLPAMAVFAFLLFWGAMLALTGRSRDPRATGFYALATGVPALTSAVMAVISLRALDALCKVCLGIYISSALCVLGAVLLYLRARTPDAPVVADPPSRLSTGVLAGAFGLGCAFVLVSVVAYASSVPDFERFVGACGSLEKPQDPHGVLVPLERAPNGVKMIEVLDPLCSACRGFEERFEGLEMGDKVHREALLFPLDDRCNWMVESALHPGACAISEAILCAGDQAREVLAWSFSEQAKIMEAERAQAGSAQKLAAARFPSLAGCIGSSKVKARLNRALRWAVDNQLPVLTPQLYVEGTRLCDADTDLGLDYMLTRLVQKAGAR